MTTTAGQGPHDDVEVRGAAAERLTVFVDAVIAIALTLLALDLPVPAGDTNSAMLRSALDHRDEYLAFVISFVVISASWRRHHVVFRYVRSSGSRLTGLTLIWLFMQVVTPFATRVITGSGAFQVRFGFYAVLQVVALSVFSLMVREVHRRHLYRDSTPPELLTRSFTRTTGLLIGFVVSIPVSFLTDYSYVCWFLGPVVVRVIHLAQGHRAID